MKSNIKDTGLCVCGHERVKHRDRGMKSCRKCDCKSYTPAIKTDEGLQPKAHEPDCMCGQCAWERLINAERGLFSLKNEVERLNKSLELEMDASGLIEINLDKVVAKQNDIVKCIDVINKSTINAVEEILEIQLGDISRIKEVLTEPNKKLRKELIKKLGR